MCTYAALKHAIWSVRFIRIGAQVSIRALAICAFVATWAVNCAVAQPIDKVVAANYPPLMIEGVDEAPGYAIEVLQEAARRAGRAVDISFLPFERAMSAVQSETATLMPALFYGKKRNDQFLWLAQIQSAKLRFATLTDPINSLEAARLVSSVVVESGTTADVLLTDLGFQNVVRVRSPASSARMLKAGRVDAWFQSETILKQAWQQLRFPDGPVLGVLIHEVPIYLIASPALPKEVSETYRTAIESMTSDGTLDQIWARYAPR